MKITGPIYSALLLDNYRFEGEERLLQNFPKNESIYFTHIVE